ncbi:AraC family transcriptional regulator [Metabacillus sp. GX 13764]|uniref:AraC family transcriptional regulator n=1 Tax=Metabacillus kandeliae TaxID=2900151 RepID=UPI001E4BFB0F|nr:AraC family transcriptional regulator [Metabacillus kandeliae]MCD7034919.1 AraC family transcriptional regulator [Metabacillus kandeliae]
MPYLAFQLPPFPTFIKGGQSTFKNGRKHARRIYPVFDLLYIVKGEMFITEDKVPYTVKEKEYLILTPGKEHFGHKASKKETSLFWIHFSAHMPFHAEEDGHSSWSNAKQKEADFISPASFQLNIPKKAAVIHSLYTEELLEDLASMTDQSTEQPLRLQGVFQELLLHLQKEALKIPSAAEKVVQDTKEYLREHYKEEIGMDKLSAGIRFNPDYITRCMQKSTGITPMQYLNKYRLAQAKKLLATTADKISAISEESGIGDAAYFSKLFKKFEGMTPQEYRNIASRHKSY